MSNDALAFAFSSGLPPGPRFVFVVLCDHAGDYDGENFTCYPGIARIARRTGYSHATVERHLAYLEANGWLTRDRRRRADGRLGVYTYVLHRDPDRRARLWVDRREGPRKPVRKVPTGPVLNLSSEPVRKLRAQEPSC